MCVQQFYQLHQKPFKVFLSAPSFVTLCNFKASVSKVSVPILQQQLLPLTLHDVLSVDSVLHKCLGSRMTMLVSGGSHRRWLDNHVVDDASSDQEVGDEN